MSKGLTDNIPRGATSALSDGYYHRETTPEGRPILERESDDYVLERASISSVLIARTVDLVVEADDSELGYSFKSATPNKVKTLNQLKWWIEDEAHRALDELVKTDNQTDRMAQRYEKLVSPLVASRARIRREAIMFYQAVSEPEAWLRMGVIAAGYHGHNIGRSQAASYMTSMLSEMQITAKRGDIAGQEVNGAILSAAGAMGTMLDPTDPEAPVRHGVLRAFTQSRSGHVLPAETFGDLYDIEPNSEAGIILRKRPEGFGQIASTREMPITCPASYRFSDSADEGGPSSQSAQFRLLRAGINAMSHRDRFAEALVSRRTALPAAVATLNAELVESGKQPLELND